MRTRPNPCPRLLILLLAALLVLAAAACSDGDDDSADRDDTGADTRDAQGDDEEEPEEISVFSASVGDCLLLPGDVEGEQVSDFETVACDQPHDAEVYASLTYVAEEGEPFPGDSALQDFSEEECVPAFADYVGIDFNASIYDSVPLVPTADSWERLDDREVLCLALAPAGEELNESIEGTAR